MITLWLNLSSGFYHSLESIIGYINAQRLAEGEDFDFKAYEHLYADQFKKV